MNLLESTTIRKIELERERESNSKAIIFLHVLFFNGTTLQTDSQLNHFEEVEKKLRLLLGPFLSDCNNKGDKLNREFKR